jgi:hypothetical protein
LTIPVYDPPKCTSDPFMIKVVLGKFDILENVHVKIPFINPKYRFKPDYIIINH